MFDQPAGVQLREHLLLGAIKQLAQIQAPGIAGSGQAARR